MTSYDRSISAYTAAHGGGTFDALSRLPLTWAAGYVVGSAEGSAAVVSADADPDLTARYVAREFMSELVGTWLRPDGLIAVDPVHYIFDRSRAMALGRATRQETIYDCATGVAIPVEYKRE